MAARRLNPIPVLVLLAAIPAAGLGALWRFADARRPPPVVQPVAPNPATLPAAMTTPLFSVRRAPGVLSRQVNLSALQTALQPLLASVGDNRCFALAIDGQSVAEKNETLPLSPASNLKILTAAVALDVLGPGFTYSTKVMGALGADGVVQGDMYLVGGGDPVLASEWWNGNNPKWPPFNETSFESLADAIQQHGVTKITGGLVGDGSRYDDEFFAPTWAAADHITQAGPVDALLANDSWQTPQTAAKDPALGAASVLRDMLKARGIAVGDASTGTAAAGAATIAEVQSQPLPAILAEMLTTSDNNTAEMVLKEIGLQSEGAGTRSAGLQVVMDRLATWGVPTAGVSLVDGSGLSDANRVTCAAILAVLEHGSATDAVGQGMPVAGATGGTLFDVFTSGPLAGKLHGKTGTLNPNCNPGQLGAKSLGGYVPQAGGGAIEFVLLQNGECIANNYKVLWDELGQALGPYPTGPSAATLAPR
ncbi:MAG: D-alanyl-D-alanine carboxypeptidase/D-alanyl-D-alanine-endopeptidase [Ilumatobacteraceae bacterium]|nr:D-alanyl-D-alanine carboxypeptidase/D-alanyl-D-alanine-endopeptidase [Ilumatobacteraceae bacterium]